MYVCLYVRVGDVGPDVMVYQTCAIIGLGGRGVIKTWTEVAASVRLYMHADVRSHLSGSSAIQPLAPFIILYFF